MFKELKQFALRGNVVDMAVGIIIGGAFGTIVSSLVNDILMPPIGLFLGGIDFSNFYILLDAGAGSAPFTSLSDAQAAGAVTINYGLFINSIISFLIIAVALFFVIRTINRLTIKEEGQAEPTTRTCPFCISTISIKASRCPHCTSEL